MQTHAFMHKRHLGSVFVMTQVVPELIPVREDEQIDVVSLHRWIDGRIAGSEGKPSVLQFARGKANLTYLLRYETEDGVHEYVVRRPPLGPVAPSSHDMGREFRVLSTLWRAFPQAARAYLFCDDVNVIGASFFVMERRHGVVVQQAVPDMFGGGSDVEANRKLSEVVVDTLADFHRVDPVEAGLDDLGHPDGFLDRQMSGWIGRWEAAKHHEDPLANETASWLVANLPSSPPATLLHNDWRLDNMAVAPDDPGTCVAVYDWDMCTRGDPLADLGTVMAVWYDKDEAPAALNPMPTGIPGFMGRGEAVTRYGHRSGQDLSSFPWYLVFGTFKMAVVLQQIYIRWHRGQTDDERFAPLGDGAHRLLELALTRRDTDNG